MDKPLTEITDSDAELFDFSQCYTRSNPGTPIRDSDLVYAIRFTMGNYSHIARLLGRRRAKVYDAINTNSVIREIFAEVKETLLDDLESGVFRSALEGDGADRRFVLTTIGKNRGYSSRQEMVGKDDGPIRVADYDLSKLSDEELEKLESILEKSVPESEPGTGI